MIGGVDKKMIGIPSAFFKYKMHKNAVVQELMDESNKWRQEGNFKLPQVLME